jgi:hypothetical protein
MKSFQKEMETPVLGRELRKSGLTNLVNSSGRRRELQTRIIRDKFQAFIPRAASYKLKVNFFHCTVCVLLVTRQTSSLYSNSSHVLRNMPPFTGSVNAFLQLTNCSW